MNLVRRISAAALLLTLGGPLQAAGMAAPAGDAYAQLVRWLAAVARPSAAVLPPGAGGEPFPAPRVLRAAPAERGYSHRGMLLASVGVMVLIVRRRSALR